MDLASLIWSLASSIQPRSWRNRAEATHSLTNDARLSLASCKRATTGFVLLASNMERWFVINKVARRRPHCPVTTTCSTRTAGRETSKRPLREKENGPGPPRVYRRRWPSNLLMSHCQVGTRVSVLSRRPAGRRVRALFITRTEPKKQTSIHETRMNIETAKNKAAVVSFCLLFVSASACEFF